jgi:glutamine synthetase
MNADGTPHKTNHRHGLSNDTDWWFGFEQEYVMTKNDRPLGFPEDGYPEPQGKYYCGVGTDSVIGRELVEQHMDACLSVGLGITGVNAEVMIGQWEYQLFGKGQRDVADDLWLSRYILYRLAETHKINIELHPKPMKGDWNGSGMHVNFSNKIMREEGGEELMKGICEELGNYHDEHIKGYGAHNDERLTGDHETQSIDEFSYGVSDRGASIRIPINVANNEWKGYLEDRRPSSNACPYTIVKLITKNTRILEPKLD